jgi:hypothetical protein
MHTPLIASLIPDFVLKDYFLGSKGILNLSKILKTRNMKYLLLASSAILTLTVASSCGKSVEACANFNEAAYLENDTISLDASCSENVDTYLWEPQAGLQMLGGGNAATERFIVLPLTGSLSRTIDLTVSNSKSSKKISKSAVVL